MASATWKMFISINRWHPEHRTCLFKKIKINCIQNIEMLILKHKWHPEHIKCVFQSINGIQNIENVYFKALMASGT